MKVAKFRELIDAIGQALNSFKSAATPTERQRESQWVRDAVERAVNAVVVCKRATVEDRRRLDAYIQEVNRCFTDASFPIV